MRRVVITGMGVVSPIGIGKEDYWNSLEAGKSGIERITLFDPKDISVKIAGEVKQFEPEKWMDKKEARRADRFIQFSVAAADMAVKDAALDTNSLDPYTFGVYLGSGEGGINTIYETFMVYMEKGPSRISPFFVPMMISNMSAAYVAIRHKAKGPNMSVVTACATSTHTMGEAYETIIRGDADVMLTGGSEAAITPVCVAGFAAMKALSTRNDEPQFASRPFDAKRDGFVIGEGAGVLVFEELEVALKRGAKIYAEVVGYGSTCDAYHITAPDPTGDCAARAMLLALKKAGYKPEDVDYINAHGTSTPLNDKTETVAIKLAFGDHANKVKISSTKSMIGHALGAAGALEAIATVLSMENGVIPPTINLDNPDPECDLNYVPNKAIKGEINLALINNFGFGGHNAVLAIKKFSK